MSTRYQRPVSTPPPEPAFDRKPYLHGPQQGLNQTQIERSAFRNGPNSCQQPTHYSDLKSYKQLASTNFRQPTPPQELRKPAIQGSIRTQTERVNSESPPRLPPRPSCPSWNRKEFRHTDVKMRAIEAKEHMRFAHTFPKSAMPPFANSFDSSRQIVKNIKKMRSWERILTRIVDKKRDMRNWIEHEVRDCIKSSYLDSWSITKMLYISDHRVQKYLRLLISSEKLDWALHDVPYVLTAIAYLHHHATDPLPVMLSAEVRSRCMLYGGSFPHWKRLINSGHTAYLQETEPEYLEWIIRTTSPREADYHLRRIKHLFTSSLAETDIISLLKAIANSVAKQEHITYDSISAGASLVDQVLGLGFRLDVDIAFKAMQSMYSFDQAIFALLISLSSTSLITKERLTRLTNTEWWSMVAEHHVRQLRHTLPPWHKAKVVHFVCMARVFNKIGNVTERYQAITDFCASLGGDLIEWWQVYFSSVDEFELGIAKSVLNARYRVLEARYQQLPDKKHMGQAGINLTWHAYNMLVTLPRR